MRIGKLSLLALAAAPIGTLAAQTLTPYSVFVFGSFTLENSEINGSLAAGSNVGMSHFGVGAQLPSPYNAYSMVVGGNYTADNGSIFSGNTYIGGTASTVFVAFPSGQTSQIGGPSPIDFAAEQSRLTALSDQYSAMPANGSTQLISGELNFIGNSNLNVFDIPISMLQGGTAGYEFVTPVGATDIVNVIGSSGESAFNNTAYYFDCTAVQTSSSCVTGANNDTPGDASNTLWNFSDQISLDIDAPVHGSILAPRADVSFGPGDVVGNVVADDVNAEAEFYNSREFSGVTPTPEPATFGLFAMGLSGVVGAAWKRKRKA